MLQKSSERAAVGLFVSEAVQGWVFFAPDGMEGAEGMANGQKWQQWDRRGNGKRIVWVGKRLRRVGRSSVDGEGGGGQSHNFLCAGWKKRRMGIT